MRAIKTAVATLVSLAIIAGAVWAMCTNSRLFIVGAGCAIAVCTLISMWWGVFGK